MKRNLKLLYFLALIALTILTSCSSSSSAPVATGAKACISGKVDAGYSVFASRYSLQRMLASLGPRQAFAGFAPTVDKVWALPTVNGDISSGNFSYKKEVQINADGTFSLNLDKQVSHQGQLYDVDWILLLINSQAPKASQIVGYIALSDTQGSLLRMPIGSSTSNIDLGNIAQTGDEALSSKSIANAGTYSLSLEQLQQIAKNDDLLKNIKNVYMNYDPVNGVYYELQPGFGWADVPASIKNTWSDPATYTYAGYQIYLGTNNITNPTFAQVSSDAVNVELYPPSDVTANGITYGSGTPITSSGYSTNNATNFYARNDSTSIMYNFVTGDSSRIMTPITGGLWLLKKKEGSSYTTLAQFDLGVANPVGAGNRPLYYVPRIMVTTDGSDTITKIELEWYEYNASTYVKVADQAGVNKALNNSAISISGYFGGQLEDRYQTAANAAPTSISQFNHPWKFMGATPGTYTADSIAVDYVIGGVSLRFVWRLAMG